MKKLINRMAGWFVISLLFNVFLLSYVRIMNYDYDDMQDRAWTGEVNLDIERMRAKMWERKHNEDRFFKKHYDNVTTKIAEIRSTGFKPDKLLIDIIYRRSYINKAVNVDSLFELSKLETSYGSNNVKGRLGELGWPQMTEKRFHAMILYFGGDTTGIRLRDYSDNVTMTDWTFAGYVIAKNSRSHNKPDPSWKRTWNNGKATGMK